MGICFSLTNCASPCGESPLGALALTLEVIKLVFAFWWSWPPAVCIPGEPLKLQADLENIYAQQRLCLSGKIIFTETAHM